MRTSLLLILMGSVASSIFGESSSGPLCRTYDGRGSVALAQHRYLTERRSLDRLRLGTLASTVDVTGDLVLLADNGRIIARPNPFDLVSSSLRFTPSDGFRKYRARTVAAAFAPGVGTRRPIGDDESAMLPLPFEFPFFGERYQRVFLNSDGNLTFKRGDSASTDRSLERFLTGPPRISLFFDDLDPSAGGEVLIASTPDRLMITWDRVPEWNETNENTFQIVLFPSGRIEMRYASAVAAETAVVGIAPGGDTDGVVLADFNRFEPESVGALAERFASGTVVDNVALSKRLYESFPDVYDAIVVWTNFDADLDDAFAFQIGTKNDVAGIGDPIFDASSDWGSKGALQSFVFMSNIDRYPSSPRERVRGAASRPTTLGLLAHEVGHRWLARARVRAAGVPGNVLLGREQSHWSFFFDSEASFLEGNAIEEETPGRFRTVETVARYSRLGLYLMGMAPAAEVSPFFVVTSPSGESIPVENDSPPRLGVTFRGVKTDLTIDDVQAAIGVRKPEFEAAPKEFHHAWVLLHRARQPPTAEAILKVQDARNAWERFFTEKTLGRGRIRTTLQR